MVKKTDVFILTEEGFDGAYKATAYDQESDALEELKRLMATKPDCRTILDGKGFIDEDETQYRVLTLDEAIGTDGKMVWVTSQKCFDMDSLSLFDWENYFSTKMEARFLYLERAELYRGISCLHDEICIEENDDHDQMFILVNGIPRVLLEFHARPVGEITNVGIVLLENYLN